ncbi:hypothetical protein [Ureibacillus sinduriensis]|uniref:Uncharacterized protein n=1 Tax=Ureibacillus sinduriensis BLB-1 = JCM 15800 TaxID=1384057 RepID=A0A0A3HWX6_9BACL|nr:hypothetical protein [Ureibacillus sinduriensis]KGR74848.1 hypothetical protein CD33_13835 [Ureibacillus sinduriensis BLB-1 = JCM 15800]
MRKRIIRILVFPFILICLGVGYNLFLVHFSGEGKATPEEALPQDARYEWIEGPKSEKEHRYFFLSSGNQFGTEVVERNFKGWSSSNGTSTKLPKSLEENEIAGAYSDGKILFGLFKPNGEVKVTVNNDSTKRIDLSSISAEFKRTYPIAGYEIWYIDLADLNDQKNYLIKVLDENETVINELSI